MKSILARSLSGAALAIVLATTGAFAQQSTNRVAAKTDWSVFVESDPTECWAVSQPKKTENTKDGRPVAVRRSDILLFVSYRPGSGVKGEVSFAGGYGFKAGSTVSMRIGDQTFELFTDGEWAWPATKGDDAKITTAMKRGSTALLTGVSGRSGTVTKDTFSLLGFTAAMDEAEKRCGG